MNINEYEENLNNLDKPIYVAVVGSRRRNTEEDKRILIGYVERILQNANKRNRKIIFISGGCESGADKFIKEICASLDLQLKEHFPVLEYHMDYFQRVNAYYKRNELIAIDCDICLAMVSADRKGGTENTLKWCNKYKKKVVLI